MSSTARDPAPDPIDGVGIAFALAAAVGFGLAIEVSRFAYACSSANDWRRFSCWEAR